MGEVMPLTPEDVSNKRFTPVRLREGYDMGEVDQFLDEVEAELARLTKENDDLKELLGARESIIRGMEKELALANEKLSSIHTLRGVGAGNRSRSASAAKK